jgi:cell division protein FtsI (penicillin-binding protein 3)
VAGDEQGRKRSRLGDARAYSPRGRTTRDTGGIDREALAAAKRARESRAREDVHWEDDDEWADQPERGRSARPGRVSRRDSPVRDSRSARQPVKRTASAHYGPPRRPRRPVKEPKIVAPPKMGEPKRRLRVAAALAMALFAFIGLRLVQLQLTDAPAYAAEGLRDRLRSTALPAPRGSILDRTGAVLAHSIEARFIAADPELVKDPVAAAEQLSPLLGIAVSDLLPSLRKKKREIDGVPLRFAYLARGVDVDKAKQVKALNLPGIVVDRDERRDVPGNDLAANLIGFTGTDLNGLAGLEAHFDSTLRGKDGKVIYEVGGPTEQRIPGGYQLLTPAQPGHSMKLTIDRDVQFMVQRILSERMKGQNATWAAAVVIDAKTGEIVAQASYPTYSARNPNAYPKEVWGDAATTVVFDPGSTHKAIVLAAALQEGKLGRDSTVEIGPTIKKGTVTYEDSTSFPEGTRITLPGLMAYSSNVGTIKVADLVGPAKLVEYQQSFGLGKATGIGLPGESDGVLQPAAKWSGTSYGSIPIGHEIAVTPLQMTAAYAAIANDGVWTQPHLIKETIDVNGVATPAAGPTARRVMSPENAASLREIMEAVTTVKNATGTTARVEGYRVCGKTGTGQQVKDGKYIAGEVGSFIGMAPADQPRYVIGVFAHTPGGHGGAVAGPAFRDMMAFTLPHFGVMPTSTKPPEFVITA